MNLPPIYTLDTETDPFKYGRLPRPFVCGVYGKLQGFKSFWGKDCLLQAREYIESLPPGIIYIHNGGRFDIFYILDWIVPVNTVDLQHSNMMLINGRMVKGIMPLDGGKHHEIRDSYAILPFPLKGYKKTPIDYNKMEEEVREIHRDEIIDYLQDDCVYLYELVQPFCEMFGTKLTIGSTSMGELRKMHDFVCLDDKADEQIRGKYYFGGRVQCFRKGVVTGRYKIYDVNSMYPYAMRNFKHPISAPGWDSKSISKFTGFLTVEGKNHGAFARREKTGIRFDCEDGIFHITIHEWKTAIRYNLFEPKRIINCVNFESAGNFKKFVDHFYNSRLAAKASSDDTHALFYKYILNSAYGKFAQNPDSYFEYAIAEATKSMGINWTPAYFPNDKYTIWSTPATDYKRFNVATAASITGAARAVLMEAIANAKNPLYCDTDSLICESLSGVDFDSSKLGSWKEEGRANKVCIAGKKLYAVWQGKKLVKMASKGVSLEASEIERICNGETITTRRDAPTFKAGFKHIEKLNGMDIQYSFVERRVRLT